MQTFQRFHNTMQASMATRNIAKVQNQFLCSILADRRLNAALLLLLSSALPKEKNNRSSTFEPAVTTNITQVCCYTKRESVTICQHSYIRCSQKTTIAYTVQVTEILLGITIVAKCGTNQLIACHITMTPAATSPITQPRIEGTGLCLASWYSNLTSIHP